MEHLQNGFTLHCPPETFPLSTDSIVLSGFVRLGAKAKVLDLGSGCGTLGLLLCAKDPGCHITGYEIDPVSHKAALDNIQRNDLSSRFTSICGDLRILSREAAPGQFDVCVSNPPYFSGGPASKQHPDARREDSCSLGDLFACAARCVRYGGDFYLVHRPERLAQLCAIGSVNGLEPKRLCLVRHRTDGPVTLVLLQCRKGGKPGLVLEELSLYHPDGTPTDAYRKLYHI